MKQKHRKNKICDRQTTVQEEPDFLKREESTCTLKETVMLHLRGLRDIQRFSPQLLPSKIIYYIVAAIVPYVTIYFSACILNELADERRREELFRLIIITLCVEFVLGLSKLLLNQWRRVQEDVVWRSEKTPFLEKALVMDFTDTDNQRIRDLRSQIRQNENWMAWGYVRVSMFVDSLVQSIVGILGAVVLSISMFTAPIPDQDLRWQFLNHPLCLIGMLVLMLGFAMIYPATLNRFNQKQDSLTEYFKLGNRTFHFRAGEDKHGKEMDIRINRQCEQGDYYFKKLDPFKMGTPVSELFMGMESLVAAMGSGASALFTGVIYMFVALKAWAGAFGVGSVTQYVGAVTSMTAHISSLLQTITMMRRNTIFLRLVFKYLDMPNNMYQGSLTTEKRNDRQYEVEFRNVSFKYPGSELWALRHVNMKFQVGKRMAVVGENGSGKTTFIKLLCRLYDPQEGQILLNGIDIRKYNYRDYMNIFSVVFQDFQLLSQPLGANVAGCADYDRNRAEKCIIDAGFGERLRTLPEGLDTYLYKDFGREGVDVSGGEAQKIAIARALYKDAPFIILDEPTAALDPIAEAEIYSKFNDIAGDKTAIYISHRLSSCKFCDEIAVFHEGAVVQQGSHKELVAREEGKYFELWSAQAQYYIV